MWTAIENILTGFKNQFKDTRAYKWFVILVVGFMMRSDHLGITSVIRDLCLKPRVYEPIMHFFRADSWILDSLIEKWVKTVGKTFPLLKENGRVILEGDGSKQSKEGRYMPGVKRMKQESETQSKPEHINGHLWGCIGILVSKAHRMVCTPLTMRIHDGLQGTKSWANSWVTGNSHVVEMIREGCRIAQWLTHAYYTLDRYFMSVPALKELNRQNAVNKHKVDIITRAKSSVVAYRPLFGMPQKVGRPRKKGDKIKLSELFETKCSEFSRARMMLYGKRQRILYFSIDLLWGQGLYQPLRFVLVKSGNQRLILVSTDVNLSPRAIIRLYSYRFRIECTFREFKQQLGGFAYHFWTKAVSKLSHFRKKSDPDPLSVVIDEHLRKRILNTIRATELFSHIASIAMGILHYISVCYADGDWVSHIRYQRTPPKERISEACIMQYICTHFSMLLAQNPQSEITKIIQRQQIQFSSRKQSHIA